MNFVEGVDVSHYQGRPNWAAVAASGRAFAFIKVSEGSAIVDGSFVHNWNDARSAGLARGGYHFFRPSQNAGEQADFFLSQLGSSAGELPSVLDVEVLDGVSATQAAAGVMAWVEQVGLALGRPLIYTSPGFWSVMSPADAAAIADQADLWVAHWGVATPSIVRGWGAITFWQYSATVAVPGISGNTDVDRFLGTSDEFSAWLARRASPVTSTSTAVFDFDLTTVRGVQAALNALGYKPRLVVDGVEGPRTKAAIAAFRSINGPLR